MAMSSMQLGLHVYGQKPLTHDVYESRRLAQYATEKKLVTQMGIQIHSHSAYRSAGQMFASLRQCGLSTTSESRPSTTACMASCCSGRKLS